ncbi:MAG: L-threonylcarbamoyladenylate synthase [Omnitrophica WOR_2 bacterium]|jgi:L-threonylcarbamoyladenylate synthase
MNDEIRAEIDNTVRVLDEGGVIIYPTDTVWGIGCDALNARSVDKVYKIKRRNEQKSLIVLLSSYEELSTYVTKLPDITIDLISSIDNPVTVIYDNARNLPKNVAAPDGTIAIRVVKDEFCTAVIKELGKPIISSSANISGEPTPVVYKQISPEILSRADYVVKIFHDQFNQGKASTIIRLYENGAYRVIRE